MAYSAVSQPFTVPFKKGIVPSSKRAVHSTRVLPQLISTEPPLVSVKSRIMVMGLNSFSCLPSLRMMVLPIVDIVFYHIQRKKKSGIAAAF